MGYTAVKILTVGPARIWASRTWWIGQGISDEASMYCGDKKGGESKCYYNRLQRHKKNAEGDTAHVAPLAEKKRVDQWEPRRSSECLSTKRR